MTTKQMPIQKSRLLGWEHATVCEPVYMRAYEVYSHIFGAQQAMVEGECRGGFGIGEFVMFLYAASFPREQWREKFYEALRLESHL